MTALSSELLGQIKNLEVRLARNEEEIRQSQYLRYSIFYEEMSAIADTKTANTKCDSDKFDAYCDHLLVVDQALSSTKDNANTNGNIVGSYRLLQQQQAVKLGGFYSSSEFDLAPMLECHSNKNFLEFGRSCVLPPYRNKRTIELLWQGSWRYVRQNNVDVMFGCASFEGIDPLQWAQSLSFLYHHARAKDEWQVLARNNSVEMNLIAPEKLDMKNALRQLPPLIKGYLRLGAVIGEQAVIDHQFNTIDVMIILPVAQLNPRYVNYYGENAERHLERKQ